MERLPLQVQTAYAELVEQLAATEARRAIGHSGGTFVLKRVKGQEYCYYQHAEPGGIVQRYVGRRSPELDGVVARFARSRTMAVAERRETERLCALLRSAGALTVDAPSGRVLAALADVAVFRLGGVLVGTHAFVVLGNMLGVRWASAGLRTEDIGVAGERTLAIAVPPLCADVPKVLESLEMGFFPVPGLSPRDPSTSFKVRGRGLRVDLLTPQVGRSQKPIPIPRFAATAQPVPYLEYLLRQPQAAAVVGGAGVLVNVPPPARFALHKLLVARARAATMQSKREKDLDQAAQLIDFLAKDRPGDLRLAWAALNKRGWGKRARAGLAALKNRHPDAYRAAQRELG